MTLPGVPDIYQGTEFWDFSLVDPDNRRPVDYQARAQTIGSDGSPASLLTHWQDGKVKQHLLTKLLQDRAQAPKLYSEGDYQPLDIQGDMSDHLLPYVRQSKHEKIVVIAPRLWASLVSDNNLNLDPKVWNGMNITLPHGRWVNVITGMPFNVMAERTPVADILEAFPIAVLRSSEGAL